MRLVIALIKEPCMKKSLVVLSFVFPLPLFASPPSSVGLVSGTATSGTSGSIASYSGLTINNSAAHSAYAASQNCTVVSGISLPGTVGAVSSTSALTSGFTVTSAKGVGQGGAYSSATQTGYGNVISTANVGKIGYATASSSVNVGTFSETGITGTGNAHTTTNAMSRNDSYSLAGSTIRQGVESVLTRGYSRGQDNTTSHSQSTPGAYVNAGGMLVLNGDNPATVAAVQNGAYAASLTQNISTSTKGTGGPSGCVGNSCGE